MAKTAEFKPIELKDYGHESGLSDDLTSKDSILNDFRFTETLDFDQQFEGVEPSSFLPGRFLNSNTYAGIQFDFDPRRQTGGIKSKNYNTTVVGWKLGEDGTAEINDFSARNITLNNRVGTVSTNSIDFIAGGSTIFEDFSPSNWWITVRQGVAELIAQDGTLPFVGFQYNGAGMGAVSSTLINVDSDTVPTTANATDLGSSSSAWAETHTNDLRLVDGITVPGTQSGRAIIYVDTADGDLKVKFGDGITKTIATDT